MQSGTIAFISFLTFRTPQKDTFESFRIMSKTYTIENSWRQRKHVMFGIKNKICYLTIKNC